MEDKNINIDLRKLITKQFFNTLSPDVCHHLVALAKERIEETEGEYTKAISRRKWDDNKGKLGYLLVNRIMDTGDEPEVEVYTKGECTLACERNIPLSVALRGKEAISEYMDEEGLDWALEGHTNDEDAPVYVNILDSEMKKQKLNANLSGCHIHPDVIVE